MVHDLVNRISGVWPDQVPAQCRNILASIAKYTSVAGYLQVLSDEPLQYLALFCQQQLDLRSAEHRQKLNLVMHELPALWPNLLDILNLEKSHFLPQDVAVILLKLVLSDTQQREMMMIISPGPTVTQNTRHSFIQIGKSSAIQKSMKYLMLLTVTSVTKLFINQGTFHMECSVLVAVVLQM